MNETTERFLTDIATRIGYDRITEIHLFPAIRQGGIESAIAVVAAMPEPAPDTGESVVDEVTEDVPEDEFPEGELPDDEELADDEADADESEDDEFEDDEAEDGEAEDDEAEDFIAEDDDSDYVEPEVAYAPRLDRHVVYTARYRATLKGPDRGKWEMDMVAEADAPLMTVDEVVRGVVARSGDELHAERISGAQLRQQFAPREEAEQGAPRDASNATAPEATPPAPAVPEPEPASPTLPDTPPPDSEPASPDPHVP